MNILVVTLGSMGFVPDLIDFGFDVDLPCTFVPAPFGVARTALRVVLCAMLTYRPTLYHASVHLSLLSLGYCTGCVVVRTLATRRCLLYPLVGYATTARRLATMTARDLVCHDGAPLVVWGCGVVAVCVYGSGAVGVAGVAVFLGLHLFEQLGQRVIDDLRCIL